MESIIEELRELMRRIGFEIENCIKKIEKLNCSSKTNIPAPKVPEMKNKERSNLIPVRRYKDYRQDLTQGTVNGLILKRKDNGLEPHVIRVNGRLYLIEEEWDQWLLNNREGPRLSQGTNKRQDRGC